MPEFRISWPVLAAVALVSLGVTAAIARLAMTSHRRKVVSGREELIGSQGTVLDWEDGRGHVFVHSERWRAVGVDPLQAGEPIRVLSIYGHTLQVKLHRPGTRSTTKA